MFYEFGKTYQKIGRREEAIRASNEGLAIRRRLAEADPGNETGAAIVQSLDLRGILSARTKPTAVRALFTARSQRRSKHG